MREHFTGGGKPKRLTQRELQEMLKNMKKVDLIKKKWQEYTKQEEKEANKILQQL